MKLILIVAMIAFASTAMAFYGHNEGPGMAPKPSLEDRVKALEKRARDQERRPVVR